MVPCLVSPPHWADNTLPLFPLNTLGSTDSVIRASGVLFVREVGVGREEGEREADLIML